jgi:hypothetical protein
LEDSPCYHPDGSRLYDMAWRPFPGGRDTRKENIWVWDKGPNGWTNPRPLDASVNDLPQHWQFSADRAGNVYFSTTIAASSAAEDEFPCVSPDGSYLLFGRDLDI